MNRIAILLMFVAVALIGQTPPKDVDGWGKVKWGMTLGEAKAAVGSDSVDVGEVKLGVHLYAARSEPDRYNALTKPIAEVELSTLLAKSDDYNNLKTLLIQKYGKPISEDRKRDGEATDSRSVWIFPSTIIRLGGRDFQGHSLVEVTYQPVDKKAKDAL